MLVGSSSSPSCHCDTCSVSRTAGPFPPLLGVSVSRSPPSCAQELGLSRRQPWRCPPSPKQLPTPMSPTLLIAALLPVAPCPMGAPHFSDAFGEDRIVAGAPTGRHRPRHAACALLCCLGLHPALCAWTGPISGRPCGLWGRTTGQVFCPGVGRPLGREASPSQPSFGPRAEFELNCLCIFPNLIQIVLNF
jgi:hypothetical protein